MDPDKKGVWIRIHMDIFGILDRDENLCRSETLCLTATKMKDTKVTLQI